MKQLILYFIFISNNGLNGFNLSYEPTYSIDHKSYKSNTPFKNSSNNEILDYIDFYKKNEGFITILASVFSKIGIIILYG